MNYLILAETEFFALINEAGNGCLETAYGGFIKAVISLCHESIDRNSTAVAPAYTETSCSTTIRSIPRQPDATGACMCAKPSRS